MLIQTYQLPVLPLQADLGITRQTAARYLDTLVENGFLSKRQSGRSRYYINTSLVDLFLRVQA